MLSRQLQNMSPLCRLDLSNHSYSSLRQANHKDITPCKYLAYLVEVIEYHAELSKLLDPSRYVNITVQIDRQRGLIDDCLHACHSEVVVAVVKPGVD